MLYYAAADKNHWGVLWCKISSSDTATMQGRFWQKQCTWWKDQFWKTESAADDHKGWHRSSFGIIPENIQSLRECYEESPRKSTCCLSQETGILRKSFLRILHDDLKLFPYKKQILQRQTDQNKAARETFCKYIIQRIENGPSLLDLNDLNNVDHCGLCAASTTLAVSPNLANKCWIDLLSDILILPKSLLHCRCVRTTDFMAKYTLIIFTCCCIVNHSFGFILVSKESRRPAVYTTWGTWKKNCKIQLWVENQNRVLYWTTLYVRWENHAFDNMAIIHWRLPLLQKYFSHKSVLDV